MEQAIEISDSERSSRAYAETAHTNATRSTRSRGSWGPNQFHDEPNPLGLSFMGSCFPTRIELFDRDLEISSEEESASETASTNRLF